jgi:signal transduction histidine kinase
MPASLPLKEKPSESALEKETATVRGSEPATLDAGEGSGPANGDDLEWFDDFTAGVAHEINNPVNSIINYAQILVNCLSEYPMERDIAQRVIAEGERIAGIVRNLLICTGPTAWGKSRVHIQDLMQDCLDLFRNQLREDGIRVILDIPRELPQLHVNSSQIRQVFLNIISNARHALVEKFPRDDADKLLRISAEVVQINGSEFVRMDFLDRGTGIPCELLGKVFKPFFSTKAGGKGNGLGLSTSSAIVVQHGGMIRVESVFGRFTRISVELPAAGGNDL